MREIEFPLQTLVVPPVRFRLRFDLQWREDTPHSMLRADLQEGSFNTQLGLYVGPLPAFDQPNELRRASVAALATCLHSINVAYFGGEPF